MDQMHLIEEAVTLAREEHAEHQDSWGDPLLEHLTRVSGEVREQGGTPEAVSLSWLHHIFRDTDIRGADLIEMGFTPALVEGVELLTPSDDLSEQEWFDALLAHDSARVVKIADIVDNTRPEILERIDKEKRAQAEAFRERALTVLRKQ